MSGIVADNWLLLQLIALVLAGLLVVMGFAIAVRRSVRTRQIRKQMSIDARIRPALMRAISDDEPSVAVLDEFRSQFGDVEGVVWQVLPKVRGASRAVLVEWLQVQGCIERQRVRTHKRGHVGRARAAEKLGIVAMRETAPDLIRLLEDPEPEVRIVAARALGKLGDGELVQPLLDTLVASRPVPSGIVSMALLHLGPVAVDGLVAALTNEHAVVRSIAAELLGIHGAIGAARPLTHIVEADPSAMARVSAASALGRIGVPSTVVVLEGATRPDRPTELRVAATISLGQIGSRDSMPVLQTLLHDETDAVAGAAAQSLVEFGATGAAVLDIAAAGHTNGARFARHWAARAELSAGARRRRRIGGAT